MIIELSKNDLSLAFKFFKGEQFDLLLNSIVEGNTSARLWIDNNNEPKCAILWDQANNVFYLGGEYNNIKFNESLKKLVKTDISFKAKEKGKIYFKIQVMAEGWIDKLDYLFEDCNLILSKRNFYKFIDKTKEFNNDIPEGYYLRKVDENLLNENNIKYIDNIKEEIECMWPSIEYFIEKGFGFALVSNNEVATWCTGEFMSNKRCGIGIETYENHQNKGLATLVACKFVEYSIKKGIIPYWDCAIDNEGSNRVAEKVGFDKLLEYKVVYGKF